MEYYAIISYSDASLINPSLIDREDFIPKSCILFLLPYYTERGENLSSYAISYDYHLAIREVSDGLTELLGDNTNVYVDMDGKPLILKVDPHDTPEDDCVIRFSIPYVNAYLFDGDSEVRLEKK